MVENCQACRTYSNTPGKETLKQHEYAARPWSKVATDLFELNHMHYLIVVDYYSNFAEVVPLNRSTSEIVINAMRDIFARFGVPEQLISDNGPAFSSEAFREFSHKWSFEHVMSSPYFAQSNGKAENTVKTVKNLLRKCQQSGDDF